MLTDGLFVNHSKSMMAEFDRRARRHYAPGVDKKVKRAVRVGAGVEKTAKSRGMTLSDYVEFLHTHLRDSRIAYVASIYRGFALLEMARVPVDPAYFELVEGCLGEEVGTLFRTRATNGTEHALAVASAKLLDGDSREAAIQAILISCQRAQVMHEGFIEAARLLEATYYR